MAEITLGDLLRQETVSNLDTQDKQIEYIDIGLLDSDEKNFYELSYISELAENIRLVGLQQPLLVRPSPDADGRYIIVSGHRRRAALQSLVDAGDEDSKEFARVPCIKSAPADSPLMQELCLIYANSDTRKMTAAEQSRQVQRAREILEGLANQGYVFKGKLRDQVAEICKMSASKVARLDVIEKRLDSVWSSAYKKGQMKESVAYTIARMPPLHQQAIFAAIKRKNMEVRWLHESEAAHYGEKMAAIDKLTCKKAKGEPCENTERKYAAACAQSHWATTTSCAKCCDKCDQLATCKHACPKLAEKVKRLKADKKAAREQERLAKEERERPAISRIMALWNRFGEARNAADKSVKEVYGVLERYYSREDDQRMVEMECLEGKFTPDTTLPYSGYCNLSEINRYTKIADLFGVSVDYLFCRTDIKEMATQPTQTTGQLVFNGWMPGGTNPATNGEVVAVFSLDKGLKKKMLCCWRDGHFEFLNGVKIDAKVIKWMALPPDEEDEV